MTRTVLRIVVVVAVIAVAFALGAATGTGGAVGAPPAVARVLERAPRPDDRPWRPIGATMVASSARLVGRLPSGRLYLVRDDDARICLLLADADGAWAASCGTAARLASTPLVVRLIELQDDGVRVGVEAQASAHAAVRWRRV